MKTIFQTLSEIDISDKIKQKLKMDYLPWSSAWAFVKSKYPTASYEIVRTPEGCIYWTDGKTCWVETKVTITGDEPETHSEILPVMDNKNQSIPADKVTMSDVNKSIKRCLVKNLALFGLGLSLWNGEELSDNAKQKKDEDEENLRSKQQALMELLKKKVGENFDKNKLFDHLQKIAGSKNPNNIKDIEKLEKAIADITPLNLKDDPEFGTDTPTKEE